MLSRNADYNIIMNCIDHVIKPCAMFSLGCQWQAMEVGTVVQEEMKFRGSEFAVKVEMVERLLIVEISDVVTADQWRGEFDPACKSC